MKLCTSTTRNDLSFSEFISRSFIADVTGRTLEVQLGGDAGLSLGFVGVLNRLKLGSDGIAEFQVEFLNGLSAWYPRMCYQHFDLVKYSWYDGAWKGLQVDHD